MAQDGSAILLQENNSKIQKSPVGPNILLIISDDQRYDQVDPYMPNVRERIFNQGIEFKKAYTTTPSCCPSRSSIFTGLVASKHGVLGNRFKLKQRTIFEHLQGKYFQGIIGKYLNSWSGEKRPEFDYWVVFPGGSSQYQDPTFNINGNLTNISGHINPFITGQAYEFIDQAKTSGKPFFLTLAYNSPHDPADPEDQDLGMFEDTEANLRESFNLVDNKKPYWIRSKQILNTNKTNSLISKIKRRRESIFSMDRSIGAVLDKLESENLISNTMIFFISDNGLNYGEHRLLSKNVAYESSTHIPFGIRFDSGNLIKRQSESLVSNIDITPTILTAINQSMDRKFDGKDLSPLFAVDSSLHKSLYLEDWRGTVTEGTEKELLRRPFRAIHNGRFILIKTYPIYDKYSFELYDLEKDPEQLNNIFYKPGKKRLKEKWLKRIEHKESRAAVVNSDIDT